MTASCSGNGQCHLDCPLAPVPCPVVTVGDSNGTVCSGVGVCDPRSGSCNCYAGYLGATCSVCADTYERIGSVCVYLPGAQTSCTDGVR